jgi:hypothetical protein
MPNASLLVRIAVAIGLAAATPVAEAQTRSACAERAQVVTRLAEKYGETLQSMGLHQSDAVMEIYASEETGTWTILVTRPDGQACLIAAGRMWEAHMTPARAPGKDI